MAEARKIRLDSLLLERGLAEGRSRARSLIMAGRVEVDGRTIDKAGTPVSRSASVKVGTGPPFVSRGGEKLASALDTFRVPVWGSSALDLGSSTGGFVDCLLKRGAERVIALDVGYGQLDPSLRNDERVWVMERVNARRLSREMLPWAPDLVTADLSFISLEKILLAVVRLLDPPFRMVLLVKPQFEAGPTRVGKGGIVRDPAVHRDVLERLIDFLSQSMGLAVWGIARSAVRGVGGNQEFFLYAGNERSERNGESALSLDTLMSQVDEMLEDREGGEDREEGTDG